MIKIAHLYYDLMNLYGDSGNIKALKAALESQKIDVSISFLTVDDEIDFNKYDIFYIGPGTFNNEKMVLNNLLKYRSDIEVALKHKFFIITGNALDLFGKSIIDNDSTYKALNIFDFETKKLDKRLVSEVYATTPFLNEMVIGFKNQDSSTNYNGIFDIKKGYGFNEFNKTDGIINDNFFGTYLIGPILVRNPELLEYLSKKIINKKLKNFEFKKFNFEFEQKAHDEYLNNYYESV